MFFYCYFNHALVLLKKVESIIEEEDLDLQMMAAYNEGVNALKKGDVYYAAKKFNEAELLYPQVRVGS